MRQDNTLRVFESPEFGQIRFLEIDGDPWMVGKDVAVALGYTNSRKALADHVDDEDKNTVTIRDGVPGNPNMTIINKDGLYSLAFSSKLPNAKSFRKWVISELSKLSEEKRKSSEKVAELPRKEQFSLVKADLETGKALVSVQSQDDGELVVSARELHAFLEVKTAYKDWFPRMCEYGFTESLDFCSFLSESLGGRPAQDAYVKLDMAKEICMLQRNEKGKMARKYFIEVEKLYNSPEQLMARALRAADMTIQRFQQQVSGLTIENTRLTEENRIMQPKADYFDDLVDRNTLTGIRETAKEFGIPQNKFVTFLMDKKYVYRAGKKLMPYADAVKRGLFQLKERKSETTGWSGTQVFITPKGRETFRLLLRV